MRMGRKRMRVASTADVKNGHAALAELLGEFDDQDGVLGGEANEHD